MSVNASISNENTSKGATDVVNTTQIQKEWKSLLPEGTRLEMVENMYVVPKKVYFIKIKLQF